MAECRRNLDRAALVVYALLRATSKGFPFPWALSAVLGSLCCWVESIRATPASSGAFCPAAFQSGSAGDPIRFTCGIGRSMFCCAGRRACRD